MKPFWKFTFLLQVKEENEEEQQLRSRAVLLEESMQEVRFMSNYLGGEHAGGENDVRLSLRWEWCQIILEEIMQEKVEMISDYNES